MLSAGYDRCDIDAARRAGVPICNNGGANSTAVSEHAILLMLAVCRRIVWQHTNVVSGRWRGNNVDDVKLYELKNRTLGIVGLGTIGKKTARLAKAFGMTVQYYDITRLTEDQADELGVRFALFEEVLRTSDIVSLHVPLSQGDEAHDGGRAVQDDEAHGLPDQHLSRPGRGRTGADRGAVESARSPAPAWMYSTRSRRRPTTPCSRYRMSC